jgi:hypothetical protein
MSSIRLCLAVFAQPVAHLPVDEVVVVSGHQLGHRRHHALVGTAVGVESIASRTETIGRPAPMRLKVPPGGGSWLTTTAAW